MCHPELQQRAEKLVSTCRSKGLLIGIGECFRTVEEQEKLYSKGRTTPGKIVTNARGNSFGSHHQWGTAFDIYRNDGKGAYNDSDGFFKKVGQIGVQLGLEWGGNWTSPVDKPHFQLPYWGSDTKKLKNTYITPDKFKQSWNDKDDKEKKMEKIYNSVSEVPQWGKDTIEKLLKKGYLKGEGANLALSETAIKILVINDRAGLYDKIN